MTVKNHSISTDFLRVIVLFLVTCTLAAGHADAQDFDKKMLGRWYSRSDIEQPEVGIKHIDHSVQEFYPNGTMTEERQVLSKFKDLGYVCSCYIIGDYSWSISGNVLYQKLLAANVTVDFVTENGKDASELEFGQKVCGILSQKKNILKIFSYKIIKIDDKEILYSHVDSNGKEIIKKDSRTQYGMFKYHIREAEILKSN